MKRLLSLLLLILPLTACSVKPPMECVSDQWNEPLVPAHTLQAELPEALRETAVQNGGTLYVYPEYLVLKETFSAEDADAAMRHLTGRDSTDLKPISVPMHPFESYRFSWTAAGEGGPVSFCGALLWDGTHYYALTIQSSAANAAKNRDIFAKILSSINLIAV